MKNYKEDAIKYVNDYIEERKKHIENLEKNKEEYVDLLVKVNQYWQENIGAPLDEEATEEDKIRVVFQAIRAAEEFTQYVIECLKNGCDKNLCQSLVARFIDKQKELAGEEVDNSYVEPKN